MRTNEEIQQDAERLPQEEAICHFFGVKKLNSGAESARNQNFVKREYLMREARNAYKLELMEAGYTEAEALNEILRHPTQGYWISDK